MKRFLRRVRLWLTPNKMCKHCCIWCEHGDKCEPIVGASTWGELLFEIKYRLGIAKEGIDFITLGWEDYHEDDK